MLGLQPWARALPYPVPGAACRDTHSRTRGAPARTKRNDPGGGCDMELSGVNNSRRTLWMRRPLMQPRSRPSLTENAREAALTDERWQPASSSASQAASRSRMEGRSSFEGIVLAGSRVEVRAISARACGIHLQTIYDNSSSCSRLQLHRDGGPLGRTSHNVPLPTRDSS
jgi:hypothetical protein